MLTIQYIPSSFQSLKPSFKGQDSWQCYVNLLANTLTFGSAFGQQHGWQQGTAARYQLLELLGLRGKEAGRGEEWVS